MLLRLAGPLACALAALAPPVSAGAAVCALDPVPAATLLLPYFDLDVRDLGKRKPRRETTILSVTNLSAAATLARVTMWTDLGVPTLAFDVSLTGYDVEDVDLWRVFQGTLPGDLAVPCTNGQSTTRELPADRLEALRLAHRGKPDPTSGLCAGIDHGDTLLRGYVTIDNSIGCSLDAAVYPTDLGYFGLGGIASNANVLGGQYLVVNRKGKTAESGRLVALEAGSFVGDEATFYHRYSAGADQREPLPSSWAVRYSSEAAAKQATELIVWQSSEAVQRPFVCDALGTAGWYPLAVAEFVAFDDEENATEAATSAFPAETNRSTLGADALTIPFSRGWLFLGTGAPGQEWQSHVTARVRQGVPSARGLVEAVVMGEACGNAHTGRPSIPAEPLP